MTGTIRFFEDARLAPFDGLPDALKAPGLYPRYISADAMRDPHLRPGFFFYSEGGHTWYHGFHLQDIPGLPWNDVQTAYGYGGPIADTEDPDFLRAAHAAWGQWCREQNVLAEFVRFHPMVRNWRFFGGTILEDRQTVWIDLHQEDLLATFETRARTAVRKALKNNVTFRWGKGVEDAHLFERAYLADMKRINASDLYFFSEEYFQGFFNWEASRLGICELDGELVAAALFLESPDVFEYHLSASTLEGRKLGAVNLLIHEAALYAKQAGMSALHLGGGTESDRHNPLLFFKASFSRLRAEFHIGKQVHLPVEYEQLKQDWEARHGTKADKVLFYRF